MTEDDLKAIEAQLIEMPLANRSQGERRLVMSTVPALIAEVRRLREIVNSADHIIQDWKRQESDRGEQIRQAEQAKEDEVYNRFLQEVASVDLTRPKPIYCNDPFEIIGDLVNEREETEQAARADERRKVAKEQSEIPAEWAQRGPDFNLWAADAAHFVRLVQANPRLWGKNSQLKYLTLRIDTRDGCYFRLEDRDGQDISPDTVMEAIRALAKDDSEAA